MVLLLLLYYCYYCINILLLLWYYYYYCIIVIIVLIFYCYYGIIVIIVLLYYSFGKGSFESSYLVSYLRPVRLLNSCSSSSAGRTRSGWPPGTARRQWI